MAFLRPLPVNESGSRIVPSTEDRRSARSRLQQDNTQHLCQSQPGTRRGRYEFPERERIHLKHGRISVARPVENLVHLGDMLPVDFHKLFQDFSYLAFGGCGWAQIDVDAVLQDAGARSSFFRELAEGGSGIRNGACEPRRVHVERGRHDHAHLLHESSKLGHGRNKELNMPGRVYLVYEHIALNGMIALKL
jgi:hypothetical protein